MSERRRRGTYAALRRFFIPGMVGMALAVACSSPEPRASGEAGAASEGPDSAAVGAEIREMLDRSARSWIAGDLDGFLDDYTADPALTFVSGSGVIRGMEEVRERYLRTYWSEGARRDSLRFEDLRAQPLGDEHALAIGRYVLYRPAEAGPDSVTGTGRFSLVLQREGPSWKIVHDHSSAAPEDGR